MSAASERGVFIEIHPFHAITLFPYYASAAGPSSDAVFAHERLFGEELFDAIPAPKYRLSLSRLMEFLWRHRIQRCHFNTINMTLSPITRETARLTFVTLLLPLVTRVCGCRNDTIVHEADQFFETGIDSCRRNSWFRKAIGQWFIRLFDRKYVLSPEVADFLHARNIPVRLLDSRSLSDFPRSDSPTVAMFQRHHKTVLSWIGPIVRSRKNWKPLTELDPKQLEALQVSIVMLCDITAGEGADFRQAVHDGGLEQHFVFFDHRPTDRELFAWVNDSAGIVCLYGGPEYGTIKTSGARMFALAFEKMFVATSPSLGVYHHNGTLLTAGTTLGDCIEHVVRLKSSISDTLSCVPPESAARPESR